MKSSKTYFLKQYTCYQFSDAMKGKYTPQKTLKLSFTGSTQCIYHDLKHEIKDNLSATEILYICKWQITSSNSTYLDLFQFNSDLCYRIQMSCKPLFVNIAQQYLYIVGGNSLYVIQLNKLEVVNSYVLGSQKIHAVQIGFSQTDSTLSGVCVYSWNDKKGYRKRFYNAINGTEDKWWSNITHTILLKKAPKQLLNSTLKIIIPGVLGLLILPSLEQISLINLSTMQIMDNCTCKLSGWVINRAHRAIIKYHRNINSQGFDDSLLISIGQKDQQMLQVFVLHVKYKQQIKQKYVQQTNNNNNNNIVILPSVASFTSGQVIDQSLCKLQTYVSYSTQGALISYLLTQTGIIYISNTQSRIPITNFVYYYNPQLINPILALQHKICQAHLEDVQIVNAIEENKKQKQGSNVVFNYYQDQLTQNYMKKLINSILRPNRYSIPFIQLSVGEQPIGQIKFNKININKLLFDWYKLNKVKNIQVYNGDIIIFRQNSMSTLLPIPQQQYQSEYQNGQKLLQFFQTNPQFSGQSQISNYNLSVNAQDYEQKIPFYSPTWKQNIWEKQQEQQNIFSYQKLGQSFKQVRQNLKKSMQVSKYIQKNKIKSTLYAQTYQKFLTNFLSHININNVQQLPPYIQRQLQYEQEIRNKSLLISKQLIINRVKDILVFYTKILKYLYKKSQQITYPNPSMSQYGKIQKLLLKYISFVNKLLQQPYYQISAHAIDLVEMFIIQDFIRLEQQIDKNQRQNNINIKDNNINIIINVQEQSWKVIAHIFDDIIVDSKQLFDGKGVKLNLFIKMLFNNIKAGFQYISAYLQNTFVPYSPYYYIFDEYNNKNNIILNQLKINTCLSNQQCHFPHTPTLLNIYCYIPSNNDIQNRLINSYVLQRIINKMDERTINRLVNGMIANRNYKDLIKNIYYQINDSKYSNNIFDSVKTQKQKRSFSSSNQYGVTSQNSNNQMQIQYQQDLIDNTRGIINLAQNIDPQLLEIHLSKLNDQDLQAIFRVNVQAALKINIEQFGSINNRNSMRNQNKYTNQDILIGWILKYRAYAKKIKQIITKMNKKQNKHQSQHSSNHLKHIFHKYVFNCSHSLQNVKTYYSNLYKTDNNNVNEFMNNKQSQQQNISDQQLIEKVCCRMVGFDSASDLYLYPVSMDKIQFNEVCPHKILPTSQFLRLLQKMLNDHNTSVQSVSSLPSIAIFYLMQVLEDPYNNINTFRQLGKYFNRIQLSKLIIQNSILKNKFQALDRDEASLQIKGYFGYNEILDLTSGANLYKSHMRNTQKHGSSKVSRVGSKKSLGANSSNFGNQSDENVYEILPFRNAYLEALGR